MNNKLVYMNNKVGMNYDISISTPIKKDGIKNSEFANLSWCYSHIFV